MSKIKGFTGKIAIVGQEATQPFIPPPIMPSIPKSAIQSVQGILTALTKENGDPLVTSEQANILASLKFKSGEYILSLEYRPFLLEISWLIYNVDYEATYGFLSVDWESVLGSHNIRNKMLFENPLMSSAQDKFNQDLDFYRNKIEVTRGAIACKRCGSMETISRDKQTRSGDEMAAIKITCLDCKYKWNVQ